MAQNKDSILVVGSGVAGLSASMSLARQGYNCILVEKAGSLGGHAAGYTCKAINGKCQKCGACLVDDLLARFGDFPEIQVFLETRIDRITRKKKGFTASLNGKGGLKDISCGAIVLATGFKPFDPNEKPNLCFSSIPNMITAVELEAMLRDKELPYRPSDGRQPETIAFVQCVGSRDPKRGHPYCSQVCCGYALRMAGRIRDLAPKTKITFFFMDIQTFGRSFPQRWASLQQDFIWINEIPGDYFVSDGDRVGVSVEVEDEIVDLSFDMMVLSVGMTPTDDQLTYQQMLDLSMSSEGFMLPDEDRGVFVVGSASGPMSIEKSITDAAGSATRVIAYMEGAR